MLLLAQMNRVPLALFSARQQQQMVKQPSSSQITERKHIDCFDFGETRRIVCVRVPHKSTRYHTTEPSL